MRINRWVIKKTLDVPLTLTLRQRISYTQRR